MNASTRRWLGILALGLAIGLLTGGIRAEDKKSTGSATGTWKSTFTLKNGRTIENTYKLKQEGEKLTGTVTGPRGREVKIEDGKVKDGKVSFQVTREFNDQKITFKYQGKLSGDTLKGKVESNRGGQAISFDWEAKRQKTTEKKSK